MSLKETMSTKHWNSISKKCKNCFKAIYTVENNEVYYQCSIYGKFKKDCDLQIVEKELLKPDDILNKAGDK